MTRAKFILDRAAQEVAFDRRRDITGPINEADVIRKILSLVQSKKVHVGKLGLTGNHAFKSCAMF